MDSERIEIDAANYDVGFDFCTAALAGDLEGDITADPHTQPMAYAHEYAETFYADSFQPAPYEGCLDALEGRIKNPPG